GLASSTTVGIRSRDREWEGPRQGRRSCNGARRRVERESGRQQARTYAECVRSNTAACRNGLTVRHKLRSARKRGRRNGYRAANYHLVHTAAACSEVGSAAVDCGDGVSAATRKRGTEGGFSVLVERDVACQY